MRLGHNLAPVEATEMLAGGETDVVLRKSQSESISLEAIDGASMSIQCTEVLSQGKFPYAFQPASTFFLVTSGRTKLTPPNKATIVNNN
jgi:hypothetical protein